MSVEFTSHREPYTNRINCVFCWIDLSYVEINELGESINQIPPVIREYKPACEGIYGAILNPQAVEIHNTNSIDSLRLV